MPTLAYNLLSVAKVTDVGKTMTFGDTHAEIVNDEGKVVVVASKVGNLYYLDCELIHNQQLVTNSMKRCGTKDLATWVREICGS